MNTPVPTLKLIALTSLFGIIGISPSVFAKQDAPAQVQTAEVIDGQLAQTMLAQAEGDIVDVASSSDTFSTLVTALQTADLVDALQGEGPFTVFAPTNEAFDALPTGVLDALLLPENRDLLTEVLTYHVVPGEVMSTDLSTGPVETLNGDDLSVNVAPPAVTVNDVDVIGADVPASNGVIHVIDEVLVPSDVVTELESRLMAAEEEMPEEEMPAEEMPAEEPAVQQGSTTEPIRGLW
ncbi:MAG: fasciclin domain-containing protein [Leptolyngbyaceae bacterium]|nr:fasciclin domain-containing protein [Leptolyngbyaceae bacterium]